MRFGDRLDPDDAPDERLRRTQIGSNPDGVHARATIYALDRRAILR